jgi:hypothetical protein
VRPHNYVKDRVRRLALSLDEFTIRDLARITGLKPNSIRTEVGRMKDDGFLINTTPGKREAIYALTSDVERRLELSEQVSQATGQEVFSYPTSQAFLDAQERLTRLETYEYLLPEPLIADVKRILETGIEAAGRAVVEANYAEGGEAAPPSIRFYLKKQEGRLNLLKARIAGKQYLYRRARVDLQEAVKLGKSLIKDYGWRWLEGDIANTGEYLWSIELHLRRLREREVENRKTACCECIPVGEPAAVYTRNTRTPVISPIAGALFESLGGGGVLEVKSPEELTAAGGPFLEGALSFEQLLVGFYQALGLSEPSELAPVPVVID